MEKVRKRLQKYRIGLLIVTLILSIQIWKAGNFVNFEPLQTQHTYKILPVLLRLRWDVDCHLAARIGRTRSDEFIR
jgi:hypothetical protein